MKETRQVNVVIKSKRLKEKKKEEVGRSIVQEQRAASKKLFHSMGLYLCISIANYFIL